MSKKLTKTLSLLALISTIQCDAASWQKIGTTNGVGGSGSCPSGFLFVPGSENIATPAGITSSSKGWCVAKSEMMYYDVNGKVADCYNGHAFASGCGTANSGIGSQYITAGVLGRGQIKQITRNEAEAMCANNLVSSSGGALSGGHLVFLELWKKIAKDISLNGVNWTGGVVGSGTMNRGHSDNAPAYSLPISSDGDGYYLTGQTTGEQKRTHIFSNGGVIWDWAGNLWEYLYETQNSGSTGWQEYSSCTSSPFAPQNVSEHAWTSTQNAGQSYGCASAANLGVNLSYNMHYSTGWNDGGSSGVFASPWGTVSPSSHRGGGSGFRCAVPAQ